MRSALLGILLAGCGLKPATECPPRIVVPEGVSVPLGDTTELLVRFFNGTNRAVRFEGLEVEAPLSLADPTTVDLPPGTCERPSEKGLVVRFTPTVPGRTSSQLRFHVDGVPATTEVVTTGLGAALEVEGHVNVGLVGLQAVARTVELFNRGTLGSSVTARVESVTSPTGSTDELCVGELSAGQCLGSRPLTFAKSGALPLVVTPRRPGRKEWLVTMASGREQRVVRVLAEVIDTTGCSLEASTETLSFGMVLAPVRDTKQVRFTNVGSGPCVVREVAVSVPFTVRGVPPKPLEPGAGFLLEVELSLTEVKSARGSLRLTLATSQSDHRALEAVELVAETPASCLAVTPSAIDFGTSRCAPLTRVLLFTNQCATPLAVTRLEVSPPFVLTQTLASPTIIAPAQSVAVNVTFPASTNLGTSRGALRVHLDPGELAIGLTGRSEPLGTQVEHFAFDRRSKVDTLFVLDDSPSFTRQHQRVRTELDRFRDWSVRASSCLDQRLGFTSTEVSGSGPRGRLRKTDAGVGWASSDSSELASDFAELSALSASGAERQSCLEAAARAMSAPENVGFRRPDAFLSILCVTDDIERTTTPEQWRTAMRADAGLLTYSVIGPISSSCAVDALDVGGTHAENVTAFNGVLGDICLPWDFGGSVGVCTPRTTFFLNGTPRAETLSVMLDGVPLPERSGARLNWSYDAAVNAVRIEATVLGRDPRTLEVRFETCG